MTGSSRTKIGIVAAVCAGVLAVPWSASAARQETKPYRSPTAITLYNDCASFDVTGEEGIGGGCFTTRSGDESVTIAVRDRWMDANVGFFATFHPADDDNDPNYPYGDAYSRSFCGDGTLPVPPASDAGTPTLVVYVDAFSTLTECPPAWPPTHGTIEVTFG